MDSLKSQDWVALGQLASTHGMHLLLDSLQAREDTALEEVELAQNKEQEERAVMLWRSYRQVRGHIKGILEYAEGELEKLTYGGSTEQEDE